MQCHPSNSCPLIDERALRNGAKDDDPVWDAERERLFLEEGRIVFDLFAPKALALVQGSAAHRQLVADRYPLIIVDEAQDTGTEQWACMEALASLTQLVCLADLDQQIYDFRRDVSPERLQQIMTALAPLEIDLGLQNNRSPGAEIVKFGNDILARTPRGFAYAGVSQFSFPSKAASRDRAIRRAVGILSQKITETTGSPPQSIGYLTNWGKGVTIIARALQGGDGSKEIPHRVVMDEAEVLLATRVVALCLEPVKDVWETLATGLDLIAALYQARGNAKKVEQLRRNATDARQEKVRGNAKCPRCLKDILEHLHANPFSGRPGQDWLSIRRAFEASGAAELQWVARRVIYLMGFNRGRRISDGLAEVWQRHGQYERARALIETAVTEDQIIGSDGNLSGINVMTMHKSKGKEFDGVIILHIGYNMSPLSPDNASCRARTVYEKPTFAPGCDNAGKAPRSDGDRCVQSFAAPCGTQTQPSTMMRRDMLLGTGLGGAHPCVTRGDPCVFRIGNMPIRARSRFLPSQIRHRPVRVSMIGREVSIAQSSLQCIR